MSAQCLPLHKERKLQVRCDSNGFQVFARVHNVCATLGDIFQTSMSRAVLAPHFILMEMLKASFLKFSHARMGQRGPTSLAYPAGLDQVPRR